MIKVLLVVAAVFLGACSVPEGVVTSKVSKELESRDSALCGGLKGPIDDLAGAILDNQQKTPKEVILKGTVVIRGYDEGCS